MQKYFLFLFLASWAIASNQYAPQSFTRNGKTYVFMDIESAEYKITYDISSKQAQVWSKLNFSIHSSGYPVFDLVPNLQKITIGKVATTAPQIKLPDGGAMRALGKKLVAGKYTLTIQHLIKENLEFKNSEVRSGFWMGDMSDRRFLEQYLPTNLEYDQMNIEISVSVVGTDKEHTIKTNGDIQQNEFNQFVIKYPPYFSASSLFFHLYPKTAFEEHESTLVSIDGRKIPFQAYSASKQLLDEIIQKAPVIFRELERDYGAWPHPHLIVYGAGSGGMEYMGATITSVSALGHEMHHSYFARGMTPARGNDGWLDEALARWRDNGYKQANASELTVTKMAGHSQYRRNSDRGGYTYGERFIAYLDQHFKQQGGMLPFLKFYAASKMHQINTTQYFQRGLEGYFNTNLESLFNKYIYGKNKNLILAPESELDNPYHPALSKQQLRDLL